MLENAFPLEFRNSLRDFKTIYCDENRIIVDLLRDNLRDRFIAPILDVGAGLGDIAEEGFPEFEAVLLDVNEIPPGRSQLHRRVTGDFFSFEPAPYDRPHTLLLCHVLQYLDDDIPRLRSKISSLDPSLIIEVSNDNNDKFGEVMLWSIDEIKGANPELHCEFADPARYSLTETYPFAATIECPSFPTMARHFTEMLIDAPVTTEALSKVEQKLRAILQEPKILVNQTMNIYEKQRR